MSSKYAVIKYATSRGILEVEMSQPIGVVWKSLILFFWLFSWVGFIACIWFYAFMDKSTFGTILMGGVALLLALGCTNYLKMIFTKELLSVDGRGVVFARKHPFGGKVNFYPTSSIIDVVYAGPMVFTRHAFEGERDNMDYTGFGATEREIQLLSDDGTMVLECNNGSYRFGRDVYFEDAETLREKIIAYLELRDELKTDLS